MKTLYHGTVKNWLPEIMREGLKPVPSHRFNIFTPEIGISPAKLERGTHHVYLAENKSYAKRFAEFRSAYLKAKPGNPVMKGERGFLAFNATKMGGDIIPNASPAILAVSLPEDWPLYSDYPMSDGLYTTRPIPPQFLKVVPL